MKDQNIVLECEERLRAETINRLNEFTRHDREQIKILWTCRHAQQTYYVIQQPYPSELISHAGYWQASALNAKGAEVSLFWREFPKGAWDGEDFADACDWDNANVVRR